MCIQRLPPGALSFSQHVASSAPTRQGLLHPCTAAEEQLDPNLGIPLAEGITSE